jgi:NadR type nicotinamide-nucleotide adenylyltransferase
MSVRRIVLTGGESTGKTTLARDLAARFGTAWAEEAARVVAESMAGPLGPEDVEPIARVHVRLADEAIRAAAAAGRPLVFLDQDLLSTVVYAKHYHGRCPGWIERLAAERLGDLYILCPPDLPWLPDPARDRGDRREEMHGLFVSALAGAGARVAHVKGLGEARMASAVAAIEKKGPG